MTLKQLFAIDLGNKAAKLVSTNQEEISIPSRYIEDIYIDGSNRFDFSNEMFLKSVDIKKYKKVNENKAFYFGKDINQVGKDSYLRESFGIGKQRYESNKFQNMLSFSICELGSMYNEDMVFAELVLGLPSEDFSESNIKTVLKYAKGQHSVEINEKVVNVTIEKVHIIPQPIGTFYNELFDKNGVIHNKKLIDEKTAIVDIGGLTKLFDSLQNLRMEQTEREQKETGMWTLYSLISELLVVDSAIKPNKFQIESVVRKGIESGENRFIFNPNHAGIKNIVDMTDVVNKSIDLYTEETINEVMNIFTHFSSIDNLIFTGGGSKVLNKDIIKKTFNHINIIFSEEGEFSNVSGFLKYGQTQWKE